MPIYDYEKLGKLLESGAAEDAYLDILKHRDRDSVAQLVSQARKYKLQEKHQLSDEYLQLAQRIVSSDDVDGIAELFSAFRLDRLGSVDHVQRDDLANKYLVLLGEAGNLFAQETLMIDYLDGLHGLPHAPQKALYWAERAIANGSIYARQEIQKITKKRHKPRRVNTPCPPQR